MNPSALILKIKSNWIFITIPLLGVAFIVSIIARIFFNITPPNQPNTVNGLTPGYSNESAIEKVYGKPQSRQSTPQGEVLEYESNFGIFTNDFIVDSRDNLILMVEQQTYDEKNTLQRYINLYGSSDFLVYSNELGYSRTGHVFLQEGIVVFVETNQVIRQIWYFTPTTREDFLSRWSGIITTDNTRQPEKLF